MLSCPPFAWWCHVIIFSLKTCHDILADMLFHRPLCKNAISTWFTSNASQPHRSIPVGLHHIEKNKNKNHIAIFLIHHHNIDHVTHTQQCGKSNMCCSNVVRCIQDIVVFVLLFLITTKCVCVCAAVLPNVYYTLIQ